MTHIMEDNFLAKWQELMGEWQKTSSLLEKAIATSRQNSDTNTKDIESEQSIAKYNSQLSDLIQKIDSLIIVRNMQRKPVGDEITVGIVNSESSVLDKSNEKTIESERLKAAGRTDNRR